MNKPACEASRLAGVLLTTMGAVRCRLADGEPPAVYAPDMHVIPREPRLMLALVSADAFDEPGLSQMPGLEQLSRVVKKHFPAIKIATCGDEQWA